MSKLRTMKRVLAGTLMTVALLLVEAGNAWAGPIDYMVSNGGQFGTIDLGTGAFSLIDTTHSVLFEDITRLPGGPLYGMDSGSNLRVINVNDGTSTIVGNAGNSIFGVKQAPNGTLFGFSRTDLYTLN